METPERPSDFSIVLEKVQTYSETLSACDPSLGWPIELDEIRALRDSIEAVTERLEFYFTLT